MDFFLTILFVNLFVLLISCGLSHLLKCCYHHRHATTSSSVLPERQPVVSVIQVETVPRVVVVADSAAGPPTYEELNIKDLPPSYQEAVLKMKKSVTEY